MLLSFVIPHYNLPCALLERCIESIEALGIKEYGIETVIVDDGSQSPPLWVTGKYPKANIKVITAGHNGPGAARNRGIEEAKGRYIMFVDADDYLIANGTMPVLLDIIERERPQILRIKQIVHNNGNETVFAQIKKVKQSRTVSGAMFMANNNLPGSPCAYIFLRELAIKKEIRFPVNCFHEDEEFNTILHFHALSLIESDAPVYCYCIRAGSTTTNEDQEFKRRRTDDMLQAIARIAAFRDSYYEKSNNIQKKAIERKLNTLATDAVMNMLFNGYNTDETYKKCIESLKPLSLYPIPKASYSFKYKVFRIFANSKTGIAFLKVLLHSKKPKKQ